MDVSGPNTDDHDRLSYLPKVPSILSLMGTPQTDWSLSATHIHEGKKSIECLVAGKNYLRLSSYSNKTMTYKK